MLRQRIVTAAVLAVLLLGSLFAGEQVLLALLLGTFVTIAAWEWAGLAGSRELKSRALYAVLVTMPLPALYILINTPWTAGIVWFGTFWWCIATAIVFCYQAGRQAVPSSRLLVYLMGYFVLFPAWTGLVGLFPHGDGPRLLLLFFVMIWMVDSAAYFAGRRWGMHKLASRVSPGKTWEGFFAGILASFLAGVLYVVYENITGSAGLWLILLCVLSAVFSVGGDLFVSMFKRHASVKNSGRLLPGHGGVLDRIDSISAAAPVFTTGIWMLEGRL